METSISSFIRLFWGLLAGSVAFADAATAFEGPVPKLGPPIVIARGPLGLKDWGPWQFPAIQRLPDGRLQVGYHIQADSATAYGTAPGTAISADNGKTWSTEPTAYPPPSWTSKTLILPNGDRLTQIPLRSLPLKEIEKKLPRPVAVFPGGYDNDYTIYKLADLPKELRAGYQFSRLSAGSNRLIEEKASVDIPGDVRVAMEGVLLFPWMHRLGLMPDGSLWGASASFTMSGQLVRKFGISFYRSTDGGHRWTVWGEIPYQPVPAADALADQRAGFTEPNLTFLPNGSILALMRTTDGKGVGPLYVSYSSDGGEQWSKPETFDDLGVWPALLTLKNGVTLAAYGRPGLYLRTTNDPAGRRWGSKTVVVSPLEIYKDTCSYSDLTALDDHSALLVYSDFTFPDEQGRPRRTILARKISF